MGEGKMARSSCEQLCSLLKKEQMRFNYPEEATITLLGNFSRGKKASVPMKTGSQALTDTVSGMTLDCLDNPQMSLSRWTDKRILLGTSLQIALNNKTNELGRLWSQSPGTSQMNSYQKPRVPDSTRRKASVPLEEASRDWREGLCRGRWRDLLVTCSLYSLLWWWCVIWVCNLNMRYGDT